MGWMTRDSFEHLSGKLSDNEIGLGWLTGVTLLSVPMALSMRPHRHPHQEAIFCLRGEFTYEIEGFAPVTIRAGMGLVIPARTLHSLTSCTERPGERLGLHIARQMAPKRAFAIFTPSDFQDFQRTLGRSVAQPFRLDPALSAAVAQLSSYLKRGTKLTSPERGIVRIICCTILYHMVDTLSRPLVALTPQLMNEAVNYMERNYAKTFRIDDLVRHMGYSRARLFDLFRKHTGLTPNNYLTRLRIRKAEDLLKTTDLPIARIGSSVGFPDCSYFSAVFKRYTGQTPEDYRASTAR